MKTLYALIFVFLASPAIADVLDITPTVVDEDNTPAISTPAPQPIEHAVDFYVDEDNVEPITTPVMKPIDAAEVQVAARDDDTMVEHDAAVGVTSPATPKIEDKPINLGLDFTVDDEAQNFELRATISEPSTEVAELAEWE
jgi:hypothetical protein